MNAFRIEREVQLQAQSSRVFTALTLEVGAWWDRTFSPHTRGLFLEAFAGGRFYEEFGEDGSALYATVTYLEPGRVLVLAGAMGMPGPVWGTVRYDLEPAGDSATTLRMVHRVAGEVDEETRETYVNGWEALLDGQLKEYVEQSPS